MLRKLSKQEEVKFNNYMRNNQIATCKLDEDEDGTPLHIEKVSFEKYEIYLGGNISQNGLAIENGISLGRVVGNQKDDNDPVEHKWDACIYDDTYPEIKTHYMVKPYKMAADAIRCLIWTFYNRDKIHQKFHDPEIYFAHQTEQYEAAYEEHNTGDKPEEN